MAQSVVARPRRYRVVTERETPPANGTILTDAKEKTNSRRKIVESVKDEEPEVQAYSPKLPGAIQAEYPEVPRSTAPLPALYPVFVAMVTVRNIVRHESA